MNKKLKSPKPLKSPKRKSASKVGSLVNLLRGAAGEKENGRVLRLAIETAKEKANRSLLEVISRMGRTSPLFDLVIPAARTKLQMTALQSRPALKPGSLEIELRWALDIVNNQYTAINDFIRIKKQYERSVMLGDHENAASQLNEIRSMCGATLWEIESNIAYLAAFQGFDSQKSYITTLTSENKKTFAAFFASNIGERNEARVSMEGYQRRLLEKIEKWNISKSFGTYIYYRLTGNIVDIESIPIILAQEAASSPYDLWETIVKVSIYIISSDNKSAISTLRNVFRTDGLNLTDSRLNRINIALGNASLAPVLNPAYEALLAGLHKESLEKASKQILEDPFDVTTFLVICRLLTLDEIYETNEKSMLGKAIDAFKSLSTYSNGSAVDIIERLTMNFGNFGYAAAISDIAKTTSTSILGDISIGAQILSTGCDATAAKTLLHSNNCPTKDYHNHLAVTYEYATEAGAAEGSMLSPIAEAYSKLEHSANTLEYSLALGALNYLDSCSYPSLQIEACIIKPWLMLNAGLRDDCIVSSVQAVVKRPELLHALPIKDAVSDMGYRELSHLDKRIELPILFYLYGIVAGDGSKDISLKVAFKQFLKVHKIIFPSEIGDEKHPIDKSLKVFFLRNVCTQETMDLCGTFDSVQKLDTERMHICKTLINLDPVSAETYEEELIELTRRLSIEEAVQQVESSRIYADTSGLARICRSTYKDLFLRYLDYRGAGLVAEGIVLEREVEGVLRTRDAKLVQNYLDSYDISADTLLVELVEGLANTFMTSPRCGIDSFIGSRIRHGSFEGAFRDPIEALKLITKIDSRSGEYESNNHWLANIGDAGDRTAIDSALKGFSKNIDGILDDAVRRLLFVCDAEHPAGIVSLWPDAESKHKMIKYWVIELRGSLKPDSTIEQLLYHCLEQHFFPALEVAVKQSALFIEHVIYTKIVQEVDRLLLQVSKKCRGVELAGMIATISVLREDLEKAKNKVVKWFTVSANDGAERSFTLQTAIEIGFKSVQNLHSRFNGSLRWDIDDRANVVLHPQAFQMINDVSYLIFGNIFEHSGFYSLTSRRTDAPPSDVKIEAIGDSKIRVQIISAISPGENRDTIEENCLAARLKIDSSAYMEVVQQKKKTGLVRLASRIEHEGNGPESLNFGVIDGSFFEVSFALPDYLLTAKGVT
ncbi:MULTISPECIES: hypothetical protein [unclassified Acidovorax]|uniref:hypothetical protein n=1 Tax=unclassified Acidovorax TaxID=2684926 RepID=UPI000A86E22A|nr:MULTISPECIES: hypothetical protein [unclassified Acidovorax]